ncbi:hypothetical protein ACNKHS_15835 [Shigella flexneri]
MIAQIQLQRLYKRLEERGYGIHISDDGTKLLKREWLLLFMGASVNVLSSSRSKTAGAANPLRGAGSGQSYRLEANDDRIVAVQ